MIKSSTIQIFNLRFFLTFIFVLMVLLWVFYIFQINGLMSNLYSVQNYEQKLIQLSNANKKLEINFLKLNSLENIDKMIKDFSFEKTDKIYYFYSSEIPIAAK